jgi:pyruvate/2-oxoglutarate dehydrogenase complex dihydrolipoamide dehydrogenase (E3) component
VCLGAGPCGESLADRLKGSGLSLAVVENRLVGGECPYWGCIPSKTMIRSAETLAEAGRARTLAASRVDWTVDFPKVAKRVHWMARDLDDSNAARALESNGARLVRATAVYRGDRQVELDSGDQLRARRAVVIATGTRPAVPPLPGLDQVTHWTNREAVLAETLPGSLAVVGGGAVGVELAQAFARLGSRVTIHQAMERLVHLEEPEVGAILGEAFDAEGIEVRTNVHLDRAPDADVVLLATGRRPNTDGFEIELDRRGFVNVDRATLEAQEPGVFAGGDVNGIYGFTHVSHYHGQVIGRRLRGQSVHADHEAIPRVTFTDPEIASVGLTEAQARERGLEVRTAVADAGRTGRGYIHDLKKGLVKLVADRRAGVLVGATIVGPRAGEMLGELALAIKTRVPLTVLDDTVHGFPTFSRVLQGLFAELVA